MGNLATGLSILKRETGVELITVFRQIQSKLFWTAAAVILSASQTSAQDQHMLLLSDAIQTGLHNYQRILAKQNILRSSEALLRNTKNQYLPNVSAGIQQDYGTINGQFGPLTPYGLTGVSSSGPTASRQSWNAAFGATYLVNTNWEVFTFGRLTSSIKLSGQRVRRDSADLVQEEFIQGIKISSAYLNLLIAQRLVKNSESNLNRAERLQEVVLARTKSGLNAGVDSSVANAEVSAAKLNLISSTDNEQQLHSQLTVLLNANTTQELSLDSSFFKSIPSTLNSLKENISQNPQLQYYQTVIDESSLTANYLKKSILPSLNLFGVGQGRGSGFGYNYNPDLTSEFSKNYFDGVKPVRGNYAAGVSLAWNILSIRKIHEQVVAQNYLTEAYRNQFDLVNSQLRNQLALADQRISNSLQSYREVPIQYKAAADAYTQKSVLYKNGLTNIVDLQQALYSINKAETDVSIAYINVWQALLMKAAASGDFNLFLSQVK
ncbi:MAG: TolC family protein [Chitinophagaceae bacterium]|nr:TolC family protein [Chitinophagaceae bacterium]